MEQKELKLPVTLVKATAEMLISKSEEYLDSELYETAINLIGMEACIVFKLQENITLDEKDRQYLIQTIRK